MKFVLCFSTFVVFSFADVAPGGLPPPLTERVGYISRFVESDKWEMILNAMVWSEGPTWWNGKLVFSDTRLGKIYSWDPKTRLVGVVVENAGNDKTDTGIWMEPYSNGLAYNPIKDELLICEHGNRGISALKQNGDIEKITYSDEHGNPFNSPNDIAVHYQTGDLYFTDPIFGKMTLNANLFRGNMHELPELDVPGYSGIYKHSFATGKTTLVEKNMVVPNGIAISEDNRMIVSYCNETRWEWWEWKINEDGSLSKPRILIDLTGQLSGQGYPDGLTIDEEGNTWATAPGGLLIIDKNGRLIGREIFHTLAVSNVFLAPDGYVYLTGNHGVYRNKRRDYAKVEL